MTAQDARDEVKRHLAAETGVPVYDSDDDVQEPIWELTDSLSNGRWLYVDHPQNGLIPVGILRVYEKQLRPAAARRMAQALLQAATEADPSPWDAPFGHDWPTTREATE